MRTNAVFDYDGRDEYEQDWLTVFEAIRDRYPNAESIEPSGEWEDDVPLDDVASQISLGTEKPWEYARQVEEANLAGL